MSAERYRELLNRFQDAEAEFDRYGFRIAAWWPESEELKDLGKHNPAYDLGCFLYCNDKRYTLSFGFNFGYEQLIGRCAQSFRRLATSASAALPEKVCEKVGHHIRPFNGYEESGVFERWLSLLWEIRADSLQEPIIRPDQCLATIFRSPFRQSIDAIEALIHVGKVSSEAARSDDFRSVTWFGTTHDFTLNQAKCVQVLWEHWERGKLAVAGATILDRADISSERIDNVFRDHPAWDTMIVAGQAKGTYRLAEPHDDISMSPKSD